MSTPTLEHFWSRVATDATFKAALESALPERPSPQDLARFAAGAGFAVSAEDFLAHARAGTGQVGPEEDGELSDELLEAVSGAGSQDSYASDPLEMDIYATWDGADSASGDGASAPSKRATEPPAPQA